MKFVEAAERQSLIKPADAADFHLLLQLDRGGEIKIQGVGAE